MTLEAAITTQSVLASLGRTRRLLVFGSFALIACGPGDESTQGQAGSPVVNGDAKNVTFSRQLPEAAVGSVTFDTGTQCSGTLVRRDVVLTAAHCFCDAGLKDGEKRITFTLPVEKSDDPAVAYRKIRAKDSHIKFFGDPYELCHPTSGGAEASATDIALVFLESSFTPSDIPELPDLYTGKDFFGRMMDSATTGFFQGPLLVTGLAGSFFPALVVEQGSVNNVHFQQSCGFLGLGGCTPYWVRVETTNGSVQVEHGDSGGPLTFRPNGGRPTIFAVTSRIVGSNPPVAELFSPTWENGDGNGDFLEGLLTGNSLK